MYESNLINKCGLLTELSGKKNIREGKVVLFKGLRGVPDLRGGQYADTRPALVPP